MSKHYLSTVTKRPEKIFKSVLFCITQKLRDTMAELVAAGKVRRIAGDKNKVQFVVPQSR